MTLFNTSIGQPTFAMIRFGFGFPAQGAPVEPEAMLSRLAGPDAMLARFPKVSQAEAAAAGRLLYQARMARDRSGGMDNSMERDRGETLRVMRRQGLAADVARIVDTDDPFRERLVHFWQNHFAARSNAIDLDGLRATYADALRPHLSGRFADLLAAAVLHPTMLTFLDQVASVGPNSPQGRRLGKGLNENLAREVLELHTLGVGAAYTQADVREFAELLTGIVFNYTRDTEAVFNPRRAEPGAETVLGRSYGGDPAELAHVREALDDLAVHPSTAAHVSGKLAAHFVADTPPPDMVQSMARAWLDSGGQLLEVYRAMLIHPAAWQGFGAKVKLPFEFVASAFRALGVGGDRIVAMAPRTLRQEIDLPLALMGQPHNDPPGPQGFADDAETWVQPFSLGQRIAWAMRQAHDWARNRDPALFAESALGDAVGSRTRSAVQAAETRAYGVGAVLASAEFNRR